MPADIKPATQLTTVSNGAEVAPLRAKVGAIRHIGVKLTTSREAARALRDVEVHKVRHEADIVRTGIELASTRIKAALVKSAMPAVGALTVSLNNETTAVDMALTNGAAGEVASHIDNRHRNFAAAKELHAAGKLTDEEHETVCSFVETDAALDIERSRMRMTNAKAAVETLHGYALSGIEKAKAELDR